MKESWLNDLNTLGASTFHFSSLFLFHIGPQNSWKPKVSTGIIPPGYNLLTLASTWRKKVKHVINSVSAAILTPFDALLLLPHLRTLEDMR